MRFWGLKWNSLGQDHGIKLEKADGCVATTLLSKDARQPKHSIVADV
jgi:hypothetical protein